MNRLLSVVSLVALLLAGCGDGDDAEIEVSGTPSQSTSSSPTQSPTQSATDATPATSGTCPFLPLAAVTAALGEEMALAAAGPQTCLFDAVAESSPASATLNVTQLQVDTADYAAGTRDLCEGAVTEAEGGDQAFACVTFVGPQGYYFEGSTSIVVDVVTTDETEAAAITAAVALLVSVSRG